MFPICQRIARSSSLNEPPPQMTLQTCGTLNRKERTRKEHIQEGPGCIQQWSQESHIAFLQLFIFMRLFLASSSSSTLRWRWCHPILVHRNFPKLHHAPVSYFYEKNFHFRSIYLYVLTHRSEWMGESNTLLSPLNTETTMRTEKTPTSQHDDYESLWENISRFSCKSDFIHFARNVYQDQESSSQLWSWVVVGGWDDLCVLRDQSPIIADCERNVVAAVGGMGNSKIRAEN